MVRRTAPLATLGTSPEPREAGLAARAAPQLVPSIELPPIELARPPRPTWPTLAALAIVTGLAALGLGGWAIVEELRAPAASVPPVELERSLAVLADTSAERYPLRNSVNRIVLVVDGSGRAVLTLDGLGRAPAGRAYRAWVVARGSATAMPAARFDAASRVVPLARAVGVGARVAVTLEAATGAERPSRPLRLVAVRT